MKTAENKTKTTFILVLTSLLLTLTTSSFAQSEYGLKGGILFSNIDRSGPNSNLSFKRQEGLSFGAFYKQKNLVSIIGFQGEILYQLKGAEVFIEAANAENSFGYPGIQTQVPTYYHSNEKLHYLSVPLLLTVPTTKFFELYIGPELNYLLSKNTDRIETGNLNKFSLGAVVGGNLKLGDNTRLDFRYSYDLTSYDDMGDSQNSLKLKNYGFSVTIQQTLFRKQK